MNRLGCYFGCGSYHEGQCPHVDTRVPLRWADSLRGRRRRQIDYSQSPIFVMEDGVVKMVSLADRAVSMIPTQRNDEAA